MILNNPIKAYIYSYGLRAKLPFPLLKSIVNTLDALKKPLEWSVRRLAVLKIKLADEWKSKLTSDKGYAVFKKNELPGIDKACEIALNIYNEKREQAIEKNKTDEQYNPFYVLLGGEAFKNYPEIVDAALSKPLIGVISNYLGAVPALQDISLWLSLPSNKEGVSSNLFHLDKPDVHFVSLFINVKPINIENGPLTFIPADISHDVCIKTDYPAIYYNGNGRLNDEEVMKHCERENVISLTGDAGESAIVDTSTCLHYGSRCEEGERVVLVFRYAPKHKHYIESMGKLSATKDLDKIEKLILSAN